MSTMIDHATRPLRNEAPPAPAVVSWIHEQIRQRGAPAKGCFHSPKLRESVTLDFCSEQIALPVGTKFVVYAGRIFKKDAATATYATFFIPATDGAAEHQVSITLAGSIRKPLAVSKVEDWTSRGSSRGKID